MAKSLPSPRTIIADVPEVKSFRARFIYNFFQPDERTNDSGKTAVEFLREKPAESFDASFIESDQFNRFTSRYVRFDWRPVVQLSSFSPSDLKISNNINKIHEEQNFIADFYSNITFQDNGIDNKLNYFVKKLARELRDQDRVTTPLQTKQESPMDLVKAVNEHTSKEISSKLLSEALVDNEREGQVFLDKQGNRIDSNSLIKGLKNTQFFTQINNKFLTSMLETLKEHSFTIFADEAETFIQKIKQIEKKAKTEKGSAVIDAKDYDLEITEFIDYKTIDPKGFNPRFQILGYFIEKVETTTDGDRIVHDPIILENPTINTTIDFKIKYGATYNYTIRSIALFETQTVDEDSDDILALRYLVASKPSHVVQIDCLEEVAPPAPADFNVRWEAKEQAAILEWAFPVNSQRDIKSWQIFRRSSIEEPFELIKVYNFDDSVIKINDPRAEEPEDFLVETLTGPKNFYLDRDFNKNSKFIYAVCSVDARGLSSNYSTQFEASFDKFNNKLIKKLVSLSGAPKPYPNWFLFTDTFVDTIRDSGHKKLNIIFNPEYLKVVDSEANDLELLKTDLHNSIYQMSIINVDLQEQNNITLELLDKRMTLDKNRTSIKEKRLLHNRRSEFSRLKRQLARKPTTLTTKKLTK